jgi:hypothetical protein
MSQPVIFVIDGDARVTAALREDLDRRFGEDFRVIGESSADSGLAALRKLAGSRRGRQLLGDGHLDPGTGSGGSLTGRHSCWRPRCRGFSRWEMPAIARSSGSPPRSVTAPRPCAWCTNTWPPKIRMNLRWRPVRDQEEALAQDRLGAPSRSLAIS